MHAQASQQHSQASSCSPANHPTESPALPYRGQTGDYMVASPSARLGASPSPLSIPLLSEYGATQAASGNSLQAFQRLMGGPLRPAKESGPTVVRPLKRKASVHEAPPADGCVSSITTSIPTVLALSMVSEDEGFFEGSDCRDAINSTMKSPVRAVEESEPLVFRRAGGTERPGLVKKMPRMRKRRRTALEGERTARVILAPSRGVVLGPHRRLEAASACVTDDMSSHCARNTCVTCA